MGGQEPVKTEKYFSTGLLAHVDAGKTTLSEALLYLTTGIRFSTLFRLSVTVELQFFQNRPYLTLGIPM